MSVSQTSIENYHLHRNAGDLGRQCKVLLSFMVAGKDYSRAELAQLTGVRLSSVCGRVNEMIGTALAEGPTRACRITGRRVGTVIRQASAVQLGLL